MAKQSHRLSRRRFLHGMAAFGLLAGMEGLTPAYARQGSGNTVARRQPVDGVDIFDLEIRRTSLLIGGRPTHPITVNGSIPGPLIRLREGREAVLRVTNHLPEDTSIHWHGILLPHGMDGVPGVSFPGIRPGETFTYRYPVKQYGTFWYHSHSGLQEQLGHYGPLIIDPMEPEPFEYDRDYVVMLSDWTFEDPYAVFMHLKKGEGYYNYQKRTVADFFDDVQTKGWRQTLEERGMWGRMRMSSRDILDVTGSTYTYLVNGLAPESNWTALFNPGERVRLRVINGSAMSYFDVRIPGLKMTVVAADGQYVEPVPVDEFRIAVAETYDIIVEPQQDRAYTIFAESMDRSGYARATLAPREGMTAPIPARRPMPERGMAAMGMGDMKKGPSSGMDHKGMTRDMATGVADSDRSMSQDHAGMHGMAAGKVRHGPDNHGPGAAMVASNPRNRLDEAGVGLEDSPHRVLVYNDLRSIRAWPDQRTPQRDLELHLTGNMERYMWSFDGRKFSEVTGPIPFRYGERLRLIMVNDSMMDHPIHLHGMWMYLDNGSGLYKPRKHTINVKPAEKVILEISADAPGNWAFHCHLLYHMEAGMFRVVNVSSPMLESRS